MASTPTRSRSDLTPATKRGVHRTRRDAKASPATTPPAEVLFRRPEGRPPPRLSVAAIRRAQSKLGVKLPRAYLDLMREQNGGRLRLTALRPKQRPPRSHTHRTVYELDEIAGVHDREFRNITSLWETAQREWAAPAFLVPLCGDGHWWLCLDYQACGPSGEPRITHFEPAERPDEKPKSCRVADSFDELLRELRFDAGGDLLFAIDRPEILEKELAQGLRKLGCRVTRAKGESKAAAPRRWRWSEFTSDVSETSATLMLHVNGTSDAWHLARPAWHPLLLVGVSAKDQDRCVRALRGQFDSAFSLIHVPTDRKPPRGVPVEEVASDARPRARRGMPKVRPGSASLNAAVLAGDRSLVRHFLAEGLQPDKSYGPRFATALETAAAHGDLGMFKLLLEAGTRKPSAKLLSTAVRGGNARIVKLLTDRGAKPTTGDLSTAVCQGHVHIVQHLLALGLKPSSTALRWAAGVTVPSEFGYPTTPNRAIMLQMKEQGLKATNKAVRCRYESLQPTRA